MCFIVEENKELTAKKDIVCYKVSKRYSENYKKTFIPRYETTFEYKINIATDNLLLETNEGYIYEGYHSYKTKAIAKENLWDDRRIGKFIIPKGAKYYENNTEYVSSTLIFKGYVK